MIFRLVMHIEQMSSNSIISAITVLLDSRNRTLLIKRQKTLRSFPNTWCFPGGVVDGNETPEEAAIRETLEEVRLACNSLFAIGIFYSVERRRKLKYIVHAYATHNWSGEVDFHNSSEVSQAVWITPQEALDKLELAGEATRAALYAVSNE